MQHNNTENFHGGIGVSLRVAIVSEFGLILLVMALSIGANVLAAAVANGMDLGQLLVYGLRLFSSASVVVAAVSLAVALVALVRSR